MARRDRTRDTGSTRSCFAIAPLDGPAESGTQARISQNQERESTMHSLMRFIALRACRLMTRCHTTLTSERARARAHTRDDQSHRRTGRSRVVKATHPAVRQRGSLYRRLHVRFVESAVMTGTSQHRSRPIPCNLPSRPAPIRWRHRYCRGECSPSVRAPADRLWSVRAGSSANRGRSRSGRHDPEDGAGGRLQRQTPARRAPSWSGVPRRARSSRMVTWTG